jgi:glycosyltransferase involved in cell wall biosynthesis
MHVLWINEAAGFAGGCEQYIYNTVRLLRGRGVQNSLLYDCRQPGYSLDFVDVFDRAFPLVHAANQVGEIAPDVVYLHRFFDRPIVEELNRIPFPKVRFIHDYKLFCLREHKYKPLTLETCDQTIGWGCYPCLGFINKADEFPGIRISRLGSFRAAIAVDQQMDMTVANSNHMLNHLIAHGYDAQKARRLYPYSIRPEPPDRKTQEDDLLLFAGQLHTGKGLDVLLNAVARAKTPVRLAVVGRGPQEEQFKERAASLGIGDRVYFEGWRPSEEIRAYYLRAFCVVVPSRFPEPFCMIGTEAMSHARPVIGTDVGAVSEWLEDGVTGTLVPPNNPDAMAAAIDGMMNDPERAKSMGETGRERYLERFVPEHHIDALLKLFEEVIERSPSHV